jgi:hypothetical protein
MREHVQSNNRRFPQRGQLSVKEISTRGVNSRVDYFFWLNDRTATIKVANAIANVKDSNTVIQHHPLSIWGCADHP